MISILERYCAFSVNLIRLAKGVLGSVVLCVCVACVPDKPAKLLELASQGLYSAALSQDGRGVVLSSIQHGGSYWALGKKPERLFNWNHAQGSFSEFRAVALSRDNRFALTAEDRRFVVWNAKKKENGGHFDNTQSRDATKCL